jgi:oxygen-independent coproporphyrinogen-3 oxidase
MNPESCEPERVRGYLEAGINRVSLGVQSFHDDILATVGRLHRADTAARAVATLRGAGLENLSLDLIAGLPGSTVETFRSDVGAAIALGPEHVSVYMLETDKPTPLARSAAAGQVALPGEDEVAAMFEAGADLLRGSGLQHYEISNFARPGAESRHNLKYWREGPIVGVGPSAWSHWRGRRLGRVRDLGRYLEALESGRSPVEEDATLEGEAAAGEALYLALRMLAGADLDALSRRHGFDLGARFGPAMDRLEEHGLLARERGGRLVRLTRRGVLVANEVFQAFCL